MALVDSQSGDLYTGDAAGVFVPDTAEVRPATPPPDFDLDLALDSLAADARSPRPTRCCSATSARSPMWKQVFDQSEAELRYWVEQVSQAYHRALISSTPS